MKTKTTLMVCLLIFLSFYSSDLLGQKKTSKSENKPSYWVEWKPDHNGFFSNLFRAIEWIYCIKTTHKMGLYLNMTGQYGAKSNLWNDLFVSALDQQISTTPPKGSIILSTHHFPIGMGQHFFDFNRYLGSGIQNFDQISYLYQYPSTYKDPNFFRFRKKVNQIIKKYIKIQEKLADKLNFYTKKIDEAKQKGKKVIGIHARCASYFFYNNEPENYLDQIKKDIDDVMKRSDPGNTVIFLATIVEPLKQYIEENYEVILQDIPRSTDALLGDWTEIEHPDPTTIPEQVIIDTWTLANCDELWGGASNVVLFAACLNPELKICFFPFIENCQGS